MPKAMPGFSLWTMLRFDQTLGEAIKRHHSRGD